MAIFVEYVLPTARVLQQLARVVVRHGHFEDALRVAFKRMLGISADDPAANQVAATYTKQLRDKCAERAPTKFDDAKLIVFLDLLARSERLSDERNRYAHGLWVIQEGREVLRYRRKNYRFPTVEELNKLEQELDDLATAIDNMTREFVTLPPKEAKPKRAVT